MVANHPKHDLALPWLQRAQGKAPFYLAAHTLAELYAVLMTLPIKPRISPETAKLLIEQNMAELEALGEALLDWHTLAELMTWLQRQE